MRGKGTAVSFIRREDHNLKEYSTSRIRQFLNRSPAYTDNYTHSVAQERVQMQAEYPVETYDPLMNASDDMRESVQMESFNGDMPMPSTPEFHPPVEFMTQPDMPQPETMSDFQEIENAIDSVMYGDIPSMSDQMPEMDEAFEEMAEPIPDDLDDIMDDLMRHNMPF